MKYPYINEMIIRISVLTVLAACILFFLITAQILGQESPEAVESKEKTPTPVNLITAIKINDEKPQEYISFELIGTQKAEYSYNILPPEKPEGTYYFYINIKNSHTMLNRGKLFSKEFVSPLVTLIRITQYKLEPTPITRVVFDIPEPIKPDIKAVKDSLLISFAPTKFPYNSEPNVSQQRKKDKTGPPIEIVKDGERLKEIISQITANSGEEEVKIVIFSLK